MKNFILLLLFCYLITSCTNNHDYTTFDNANQKVFEMRYNYDQAKHEGNKVLQDLRHHAPSYVRGKAIAWNNLAEIYFLQDEYYTAKSYIDSVKQINYPYQGKNIEEDIASILEAEIFSRETQLHIEWGIYDSLNHLNIAQKHNKFHNESQAKRYYTARLNLYFGLLRTSNTHDENKHYRNFIRDTTNFPPSYLDYTQLHELHKRISFHCYQVAIDTSLSQESRIGSLQECFLELYKWAIHIKNRGRDNDTVFVTSLYEFFTRIINDERIQSLIVEKGKHYFRYDDVVSNICNAIETSKNINTNDIQQLSIHLLKESIRISDEYSLGPLYRAYYRLMLGHYYYIMGKIQDANELFYQCSFIERNYITTHENNSLRINRNLVPEYKTFLENSSNSDLINIFDNEDNKAHIDRVLLNWSQDIYKRLRKKDQSNHYFSIIIKYLIGLIICLSIHSIIATYNLTRLLKIIKKDNKVYRWVKKQGYLPLYVQIKICIRKHKKLVFYILCLLFLFGVILCCILKDKYPIISSCILIATTILSILPAIKCVLKWFKQILKINN